MTVNNSRPKRGSLLKGAAEGRYVEKARNQELAPGMGEHLTDANRRYLMKEDGYGLIGDLAAHGDFSDSKPIPGTW
jgi:hypothetical protein